jgi:hypothetical protein
VARARRAGRGRRHVRDRRAPARASGGRHPARARDKSTARERTAGTVDFLHLDDVIDSRVGDVDHRIFFIFIVFDDRARREHDDHGQRDRGAGDVGRLGLPGWVAGRELGLSGWRVATRSGNWTRCRGRTRRSIGGLRDRAARAVVRLSEQHLGDCRVVARRRHGRVTTRHDSGNGRVGNNAGCRDDGPGIERRSRFKASRIGRIALDVRAAGAGRRLDVPERSMDGTRNDAARVGYIRRWREQQRRMFRRPTPLTVGRAGDLR